jgi:hypothetical protein
MKISNAKLRRSTSLPLALFGEESELFTGFEILNRREACT